MEPQEPQVLISVLTSLATISEQESQIGPGWLIVASVCRLGLQLNLYNTCTRTSAAHVFPWTELSEDLPSRWKDRIVAIKEQLK